MTEILDRAIADVEAHDDSALLIERLKVDRALFTQLVLATDPIAVITAAGFEIDPGFHKHVMRVVKNTRTYIHDQVSVLEKKYDDTETFINGKISSSGNSAVDW